VDNVAVEYMVLDGERFDFFSFKVKRVSFNDKQLRVKVKYFALNKEGGKFKEYGQPATRENEFILEKYIDNKLYIKTITNQGVYNVRGCYN